MIEIIERGKRTVTKCKKCGCKFSYESEDVQRKYSFIDDPKRYGEYVMCPQCNEKCRENNKGKVFPPIDKDLINELLSNPNWERKK